MQSGVSTRRTKSTERLKEENSFITTKPRNRQRAPGLFILLARCAYSRREVVKRCAKPSKRAYCRRDVLRVSDTIPKPQITAVTGLIYPTLNAIADISLFCEPLVPIRQRLKSFVVELFVELARSGFAQRSASQYILRPMDVKAHLNTISAF